MIDINFIKQNPDEAKKLFAKRSCKVDVDEFLSINNEFNTKKALIDKLKFDQKNSSIKRAKEIKKEILNLKQVVSELEEKRNRMWLLFPNILAEGTPEGDSDEDNVEIKRCGQIPVFNFNPKAHDELGKNLKILDLERGAKVSGSGFYYLVGDGAELSHAVYEVARKILKEDGFKFVIPPVLASQRTFLGTGYFPFEPEGNYKIENQNLYAIGTSEQTLLAFHDNEIIDYDELPIKYSAYTPCFRTEAGSYGKNSKGAFRVHQFHKMEQIIFCDPKDSEKYHEMCLSNIEKLLSILEIPYHVVRVCVGDMGAPGYKKYDVESWFPSFNAYRETHSNTNLWDYQTRRLNIRTQINGKKFFPHTISSTMATDRVIFSLIENFQQSDGSIVLPKVLADMMGKKILTVNKM